MDYFAVKLVHQGAVALSLTGFFHRGLASFSGASWVTSRMAKTLPHIIDSVLLMSGLALAWMLRATPMNSPWLAAKIAGLFLYVGLGMLALRPRRSLTVRASAWVAALATAGWIVSVATSKSASGFFGSLAALPT